MPAAAVIPAPIAYIGVAAVKKLVVGSRRRHGRTRYAAGLTGDILAAPNQRAGRGGPRGPALYFGLSLCCSLLLAGDGYVWRGQADPAASCVYLEKIRVLKAG